MLRVASLGNVKHDKIQQNKLNQFIRSILPKEDKLSLPSLIHFLSRFRHYVIEAVIAIKH
jgi:hypothetical protein